METSRTGARSICLLLWPGCGSSSPAPGPSPPAAPDPAPTYRATIRWTSHGVPHVTAADLGGLAFGQGYAFATQHACVLADQVIKLRSERAKLLGPGEGDANIGPEALPPDCAGAAWVRPIDELDLLAHWAQLAVVGSSGLFVDAVAAARPPGGPGPAGRRGRGAAARGLSRLGLTGTRWLVDGDVYPARLAARGLAWVRPSPAERGRARSHHHGRAGARRAPARGGGGAPARHRADEGRGLRPGSCSAAPSSR